MKIKHCTAYGIVPKDCQELYISSIFETRKEARQYFLKYYDSSYEIVKLNIKVDSKVERNLNEQVSEM